MSRLLDVNVLVALAWPNHVHHGVARRWFGTHHGEGWATCSVTEAGFIRVSSSVRASPDARPPGEAALLLSRMCALPGHEFLADTVSLAAAHHEVGMVALGSSHVTDLHLILISRQEGASFVTFDRAAADMATRLGVAAVLLTL